MSGSSDQPPIRFRKNSVSSGDKIYQTMIEWQLDIWG